MKKFYLFSLVLLSVVTNAFSQQKSVCVAPPVIAEVNGHVTKEGLAPGAVLYLGKPSIRHHSDISANAFLVVEKTPEHFGVKGYMGISKSFMMVNIGGINVDMTLGGMIGAENDEHLVAAPTVAPFIFARTHDGTWSLVCITMVSVMDLKKTTYMFELWHMIEMPNMLRKYEKSAGLLNYGNDAIGPVIRICKAGHYLFVGPTYNVAHLEGGSESLGCHFALGIELSKPIKWLRETIRN
jgi:hypothetical protein